MVLIDDQVEAGLPSIPATRRQNRGPLTTGPHDLDPVNILCRRRTGKRIGEPPHLMAAIAQGTQVAFGDSFRPAGKRVLRVTPIEH